MGNNYSGLDDTLIQKGDGDLIYAKMTRNQYKEFIKFLEYKKQKVAQKKKNINENKNLVSVKKKNEKIPVPNKLSINDQEKRQKIKECKLIDDLKDVINNKEPENNNLTQPRGIQNFKNTLYNRNRNSPKRLQTFLGEKKNNTQFKDNYENIFQQRQNDMNKSYFTTLEKLGEIKKHETQFELNQEHRFNLKKTKTDNKTRIKQALEKELNEELSNFTKEINPYKLMDLDQNCSLKDLEKKYKKIAIQVHPDRGGNNDAFQALTKAYLSIKKDLEMKIQDKDFFSLKKNSQIHNNEDYDNAPLGKGEKFNNSIFNQIYEENKLENNNDIGYSNWIKNNTIANEKNNNKKELFNDKFNLSVFNSVFNDNREIGKKNTQILKYDNPKPISNSNINFMEIDTDEQKGFTKENKDCNLFYTDYKEAMTNTNNITCNNLSENLKVRDIKSLKKERKNISFTQSPEEIRLNAIKKKEEKQKEYQRLERIKKRDQLISKQYLNINNRLENTKNVFQLKN